METKKQKGMTPPKYDEAFKEGAIRMVTEQGRLSSDVVQELGICVDTLLNPFTNVFSKNFHPQICPFLRKKPPKLAVFSGGIYFVYARCQSYAKKIRPQKLNQRQHFEKFFNLFIVYDLI